MPCLCTRTWHTTLFFFLVAFIHYSLLCLLLKYGVDCVWDQTARNVLTLQSHIQWYSGVLSDENNLFFKETLMLQCSTICFSFIGEVSNVKWVPCHISVMKFEIFPISFAVEKIFSNVTKENFTSTHCSSITDTQPNFKWYWIFGI